MKLLIIRHGESEADLLHVHEGRADFNLTARGNEQAKSMAKWVSSNYNVSKIYASPLKRAAQTAQYLAQSTAIPVIYDDNLKEFNNGQLAGLSKEEALIKYPPVPNLAVHQAVYNMESKLQFRYRADVFLSTILSENEEDITIAIISHGGLINQLFHSILKLPLNSDMAFFTGDTGIHLWEMKHNMRYLHFANAQEHLKNI